MSQAQPGAGASYGQPYAFDQPRYPGGYTPTDAYNNSPYGNPGAASSGYAPSNNPSYYGQPPAQAPPYGQPQGGYPTNAYIPPSQLLNNYRG
ncbi:hypothetical protein CVT26_006976 [Gymnopilus dilepis]|uniref:Uncharacterized protein n=1 Tax=Gymnopilus dilepis TaxID=231916 RepID=A0A409W148_9AGAR|nr:hypothetical protein CVT26_006976 [Gymnopilus dilepis]